MAEKIKIDQLVEGFVIGGFLAVIEATRRDSKGGPFLSLLLTDGKEEIRATQWKYPDSKPVPEIGKIIALKGSVGNYMGNKQLNITVWGYPMPHEHTNLNDYRPTGVNLDTAWENYKTCLELIQNKELYNIVSSLYTEHKTAILACPAGKTMHHAYAGGLLEHSVQVAEIAAGIAGVMGLRTDILRAGGLLHDIGKIRCYAWKGIAIQITAEADIRDHAVIGAAMIPEGKYKTELDHLIYSHHGELEWGAVVSPKTPEAMALHLADMASAKSNQILCALGDGEVTGKVWPFGHKFYRRLSDGQ